MAYSKEFFSGSTLGRQIKITATSLAGANTIHTVPDTAGIRDEIWLYAVNTDSTTRLLTIMFGSNTDPDDLIEVLIPPTNGLTLVIPGCPLGQALIVKAFAEAANVIMLSGYVNRIT